MLPILKRLKESGIAGTIVKNRTPDQESDSQDDSDAKSGKEACGRAMLEAIKKDDALAMAEAALDLFAIGDSEPHEEGSHTEPHSYDAQNIKAGKE